MKNDNTIRICMTDLNWSTFEEPRAFTAASAPQDWAFIDPEAYFKYHLDFGCNIGFCQAYTFGGYAFYPSKLGPVAPGPGTELLPRLYELSKNAGLPFMSYFSVSWDLIMGNLRNEWVLPGSREVRHYGFMAPESPWTSLLCERIQEFLEMYPVEWLLLDMFLYGDLGSGAKVQPAWFVKKPFQEIIGRPMPDSAGKITEDESLRYKREVMARQFRAIKETIRKTSPNTKLFFNVPYEKPKEPLWVDHPMMQESDALFAECSNEDLLEWLLRVRRSEQRVMTTLVGRMNVKENKLDRELTNPDGWKKWYEKGFDMFGYAFAIPPDFLPHPRYKKDLALVHNAFSEIAALED